MTKEIDIQRQIIEGVTEAGGWGKKMSNMWTSGIPDLLLSVPWTAIKMGGRGKIAPTPFFAGFYVVEIKTVEAMPRSDNEVVKFAHPLTPLQDRCLIEMRRAEGRAGWWAVRRQRSHDEIFVGVTKRNIPARSQWEASCIIRKRGQPWGEILWPLLERTA